MDEDFAALEADQDRLKVATKRIVELQIQGQQLAAEVEQLRRERDTAVMQAETASTTITANVTMHTLILTTCLNTHPYPKTGYCC